MSDYHNSDQKEERDNSSLKHQNGSFNKNKVDEKQSLSKLSNLNLSSLSVSPELKPQQMNVEVRYSQNNANIKNLLRTSQ